MKVLLTLFFFFSLHLNASVNASRSRCTTQLIFPTASPIQHLAISKRRIFSNKKFSVSIISSDGQNFFSVYPFLRHILGEPDPVAFLKPLEIENLPPYFSVKSFEIAHSEAEYKLPACIYGVEKKVGLFLIDPRQRFHRLPTPFEAKEAVISIGSKVIATDSSIRLFAATPDSKIWKCDTSMHKPDCNWELFSQTPLPIAFLKALTPNLLVGATEGSIATQENAAISSSWYRIEKKTSRLIIEAPYWLQSFTGTLNGSHIRIEANALNHADKKIVGLTFRSGAKGKLLETPLIKGIWSRPHNALSLISEMNRQNSFVQSQFYSTPDGLVDKQEYRYGRNKQKVYFFPLKMLPANENIESLKKNFEAGDEIQITYPKSYKNKIEKTIRDTDQEAQFLEDSFFEISRIAFHLNNQKSLSFLKEKTQIQDIEGLSLFLLSLNPFARQKLLFEYVQSEQRTILMLNAEIKNICKMLNTSVGETLKISKEEIKQIHFSQDLESLTYPRNLYIPWLRQISSLMGFVSVFNFKKRLVQFLEQRPSDEKFVEALKTWLRYRQIHPLWENIFPSNLE